jgi:hypothetical protein
LFFFSFFFWKKVDIPPGFCNMIISIPFLANLQR